MNRRVKGFALMEVVISLLIASILAGFGYYAYEMFTQQYSEKKQEILMLEDINRFRKQMQKDCFLASTMEGNNEVLSMELPDENIQYVFEDSLVKRVSTYTDVYKIIAFDIIAQQSVLNKSMQKPLLEHFSMNIMMEQDVVPLYLFKEYGLDIKMQNR